MDMKESFYTKVYRVVKEIPYGKVSTYGDIAKKLGSPRASRAVGYALHFNPNPAEIHCFKVVNRFGKLSENFAFGGLDAQKKLLATENIEVDENYMVNLDKYRWIF